MDEDILKLENQLCFPLYACAKEVVRRYAPLLDEIGLTYTQYITMMVLWEKKSVNVKTLGEYLYLDSGTMTPLLKKLEQKELVVRERLPSDERNVRVSITEEGELLKQKALSIPKKMSECISLHPEDAQKLYKLLYLVLNGMEKD